MQSWLEGSIPVVIIHPPKQGSLYYQPKQCTILQGNPSKSQICIKVRISPHGKFICAMVKSRYIGDGRPPTFNDGILIMGPYKPLRTWVDDFPIPYYMEISWELIDPIAHPILVPGIIDE